MIWSEVISYFITLIAGGAAGAVLTYYLNKKGNKEARELKKEELRIRNEELALQKEKQRLEDLPDIVYGNTMSASPITGDLKIELVNQGADCSLIDIDATKINGILRSPIIPFQFKKQTSVLLELNLPKGSMVLTHTFPAYKINFKVKDKHLRIYSGIFEVKNIVGYSGVNVSPLILEE